MAILQSWRQSLLGQSRLLTSVPNLFERPYCKVHESERRCESSEETLEPFLQPHIRAPTGRPNWCIIYFFFLFNTAALVTIYFGLADRPIAPLPGRGFFPPAQYEERIFHDDNLRPGPGSDADWAKALPPGNGFVIVNDPERYGLPNGIAYFDGYKRYGVTWAHQFHCIWMLRSEFWRLVERNSTLAGADLDSHDADSAYLWHLAHCFGYLRQTIVCNMDMTLEYPTLKGANEGTVNGYEIPHQCVRREPWDEFVDEHKPDPREVRKTEERVRLKKEERKHQSHHRNAS
ncbi:hypothetical protein MMC27_000623 [Xylographa pallens]|nr:hypothetical protein [Xylographa pallens]